MTPKRIIVVVMAVGLLMMWVMMIPETHDSLDSKPDENEFGHHNHNHDEHEEIEEHNESHDHAAVIQKYSGQVVDWEEWDLYDHTADYTGEVCTELVLDQCLGGGKFGAVFSAKCTFRSNGQVKDVAVKYGKWWHTSDKDKKKKQQAVLWASGRKALQQELEMLKLAHDDPSHPGKSFRNIYRLFGVHNIPLSQLRQLEDNTSNSNRKQLSKCLDPKAIGLLDTVSEQEYPEKVSVQSLILEYAGEQSFWHVLRSHTRLGSSWQIGPPAEMRHQFPEYYAGMYDIMIGFAKGLKRLHSIRMAHKDLDIAGKNAMLKTDDHGVTAFLIDLGVSDTCEADTWETIHRIEMYDFANILYVGCYRRDTWPAGGEVHHTLLKCSSSKKLEEAVQKLQKYHIKNHVGALVDSQTGANDKKGSRIQSDSGQAKSVTNYCTMKQGMDELMYDIWQPALVPKMPAISWDEVIFRLEELKAENPAFYDV
eukprot:Rmarinus@m.18465